VKIRVQFVLVVLVLGVPGVATAQGRWDAGIRLGLDGIGGVEGGEVVEVYAAHRATAGFAVAVGGGVVIGREALVCPDGSCDRPSAPSIQLVTGFVEPRLGGPLATRIEGYVGARISYVRQKFEGARTGHGIGAIAGLRYHLTAPLALDAGVVIDRLSLAGEKGTLDPGWTDARTGFRTGVSITW